MLQYRSSQCWWPCSQNRPAQQGLSGHKRCRLWCSCAHSPGACWLREPTPPRSLLSLRIIYPALGSMQGYPALSSTPVIGLLCTTTKGNQQCSCIVRCSPICKHAATAVAVVGSILPSICMLQAIPVRSLVLLPYSGELSADHGGRYTASCLHFSLAHAYMTRAVEGTTLARRSCIA